MPEENEVSVQAEKEEQSSEPKREKVRVIPIQYIDDFPEHLFKVRDDEDMNKLVESITETLYYK